MDIERLSAFAKFLGVRSHTNTEVFRHIQRVVLAPIHCSSLMYFRSNLDQDFVLVGNSGLTIEQSRELLPAYSLTEDLPVAIAIRTGTVVWVENSPTSLQEFPLLDKFPKILLDKTLIVTPVFKFGIPSSAFAITIEDHLPRDEEVVDFLLAVSYILSLSRTQDFDSSFYDSEASFSSKESVVTTKSPILTERQMVIMKLVSEGHTNADISQILGYSESTIRQEIMKIFKLYNVHHRSEVADVFHTMPKL